LIKNNIYFSRGLSCFKNRDYKNALYYFNQQIKVNPFHSDSYYFIGKINFLQRNYSAALNYFNICLKTDPKHEFYNLYAGKTLLALKQSAKAIDYLTIYQQKNKDGNFYLALAYYNLNNFYESVMFFRKCPESFMNKKLFCLSYSASLFNLGNIYYINNYFNEAVECFKESISVNHESYPAIFQLGQIHLHNGEYHESRKYFEHLYDKFKKNESIKMTLAYIYNNTNELQKLEEILKNIETKKFTPASDYIDFRKILGFTLFRQKKYKEAIPVFIQLYRSKRYDEYILYYLAQSRYMTNDFSKAVNAYKLVFEITDKNLLFNNSFLLMLIQEQKFAEARDRSFDFIKKKRFNDKTVLFHYYSSIFSGSEIHFDRYYKELRMIYSTNPMFIEATAYYFYRKNLNSKAIEFYYKLHCMMPNDEHTLSKMIELFDRSDFKKEAIYYTKKMYESNSGNENAAFYYSYFLVKKGDFETAIDILKKIKADQSKAFYLLSEIFFKMKDNKRGFGFLKKSFELNPLFLPIQFKSFLYFYRSMNYTQCLRICKLMSHTNSEFKRVIIYEALVYIKKNRYDLAINRLEKYLFDNRKKHNPYIKFILSCCYYLSGMTDQTKKIILHLIKENGNQSPYLVMLALCYRRNYQLEKVREIETVLKKNFKNASSFNEYVSKYVDIEEKYSFKRNDLGAQIP
jgi:tetratricopeptide (TPR) repeat protein